MNTTDTKYAQYALVREMFQTADVIRRFDAAQTADVSRTIAQAGRLLLTGEGSSRIFPAKNAIRRALTWGVGCHLFTDGSWQSAGYNLRNAAVFCASNSGKTKEIIALASRLREQGNRCCFGLSAHRGVPLETVCEQTFHLTCGGEDAVAATKSVVEQAFFYESIVWNMAGRNLAAQCPALADAIHAALSQSIDPALTAALSKASTIYFAGFNDGVAEELTLKTNEIVRVKSDYLEGTYALHGIEEIMLPTDAMVVIDPIDEEIQKYHDIFVKSIGMTVIAISDHDTILPTIKVPATVDLASYVQLAAGWNLLVETGIARGVNLDKPVRARKVGNEFVAAAT